MAADFSPTGWNFCPQRPFLLELNWEGSMRSEENLQLHFDLLSHRALLSCGDRDYVLPDSYPTKEMARLAAQKFAWETLGLKDRTREFTQASDLPVWLR
ncbi:hypothetical protein QN224_07990 [Sinorhizobium sp. 8-89]|uniref:hypothetical protein n=2 Tax=Sinorhizobium TaxID=28105 RepID=UPI0024C46CFD|nr:hypothetical protein [Sinorhizobium sp. 7-81]